MGEEEEEFSWPRLELQGREREKVTEQEVAAQLRKVWPFWRLFSDVVNIMRTLRPLLYRYISHGNITDKD